jgi:hypothetical protein
MHQSYTSITFFRWEQSGEQIVITGLRQYRLNKQDLRCFEPAQYITRFKRAKQEENASSPARFAA